MTVVPRTPRSRSRAGSGRPRILSALAGTTVVACAIVGATPAFAAGGTEPQPNDYGHYFVDTYQTNVNTNLTPQTNAAIAVLDPFLRLWQPGTSWDDGTPVDATVLDSNIAQAVRITHNRTDAQATAAYLYDRRNQSYSAIEGFGPYADAVRTAANAGTTIPDAIPADATTVKYDDKGNANGAWADTTSSLGDVVQLVNTLRGPYSSGNNAKAAYQYPRPWRQSPDVVVVPQLEPAKSPTPATDGGFPSGHTNAVYLADLAFAYAYPERFTQMLTQASAVADSRIVAGMHSPLDVMGGRILATALAASILDDPANATLAANAHAQAEAFLATAPAAGTDPFADYAANRAAYRARLTYGFTQTGDTTVVATVPKGAEALLRTRYPYLDDDQIREVLRTTALPSGYPLLDDAEGWGRLDLFSAASGYGAFDDAVTVDLDATAGGLKAADTWRNDISGAGSLTLTGTGALTLAGANAYTGGTVISGGTLTAASPSALGTGSVSVGSAILAETTDGTVTVGGLDETPASTLALTLESGQPALHVAGTAALGGTLVVHVADGVVPAADTVLISADRLAAGASFDKLEIDGLPAGYDPTLEYRDGAVHLVDAAAPGGGTTKAAVSLSVDTVAAGGSLTVTGTGLPAATTVQVSLHSDPVTLRSVTVAPDGTLSASVVIPAATAAGTHAIVLEDGAGRALASAPLTVLAAAPAGNTPGTLPGQLPATGVDGSVPFGMAAAAVLLVGLGGTLMFGRRRMKRS